MTPVSSQWHPCLLYDTRVISMTLPCVSHLTRLVSRSSQIVAPKAPSELTKSAWTSTNASCGNRARTAAYVRIWRRTRGVTGVNVLGSTREWIVISCSLLPSSRRLTITSLPSSFAVCWQLVSNCSCKWELTVHYS